MAIYLQITFWIYLIMSTLAVPTIDIIGDEYILGAHRGASLDFEENTLESFELAVADSKYNFIEFDIHYSLDKEIVVFHENNMFRFAKEGVDVENMSYEELQEVFDFYIPTYSEVMDLIGDQKPINIEIKSHEDFEKDKELVDFIVADCVARGIDDQVLISSISEDIVLYLNENYPEIKTGKIYWTTWATWVGTEYLTETIYNETEADYVMMHGYNLNNYELLCELKPEDKEIVFWYFTDEMYIIGDAELFWE